MPETNDNDNDAAPIAWVTVRTEQPTPNARFAAFLAGEDGAELVVRPVDLVALQQVADDDGVPVDSRIVPLLIDWDGGAKLCTVTENNGFAGLGATEEEARARGRLVQDMVKRAAEAPAEPAAS
jgi:hypothetical protein